MSSRALQRRGCSSQIDAAGLRVEPDRRLVEEQHPRRVQQAAGDLQPALHAAGERAHQVAAAVPEPTISSTWSHARARRRRAGTPYSVGVEAQVLLGGQVVVQRGVLEHQADVAAHLRRAR